MTSADNNIPHMPPTNIIAKSPMANAKSKPINALRRHG